MIPLGSVGGCHIKVTEEAVTFTTVTFCGGSNGSERRDRRLKHYSQMHKENGILYASQQRKPAVKVCSTCFSGGEADIDQHSSVSQSGPAGDGGIIATLWVHVNNHWCLCHILPRLTSFIPNKENKKCLPHCQVFFLTRRSLSKKKNYYDFPNSPNFDNVVEYFWVGIKWWLPWQFYLIVRQLPGFEELRGSVWSWDVGEKLCSDAQQTGAENLGASTSQRFGKEQGRKLWLLQEKCQEKE